MIEHLYLASMILMTSPFNWNLAWTLTLTFDILQGQIFCHMWDHNSPNLLVHCNFYHTALVHIFSVWWFCRFIIPPVHQVCQGIYAFHFIHVYSLWQNLSVRTKSFDTLTLTFDLLMKKLHLGYYFWTERGTDFILHMWIPCCKTLRMQWTKIIKKYENFFYCFKSLHILYSFGTQNKFAR